MPVFLLKIMGFMKPDMNVWEADILPLNYTCKVILLFANYAIIAWNTIKVKAFLNRGLN